MASMICEIISGGVRIIPSIKARTIMAGLARRIFSGVDSFVCRQAQVMMGTWKAKPKARHRLRRRSRYWAISGSTVISCGVNCSKNLNMRGRETQ